MVRFALLPPITIPTHGTAIMREVERKTKDVEVSNTGFAVMMNRYASSRVS